MSPTLKQIALAITKPAPSIAMTGYVFLISAVIYSMYGFHFFKSSFTYSDDTKSCTRVFDCFLLIAIKACA